MKSNPNPDSIIQSPTSFKYKGIKHTNQSLKAYFSTEEKIILYLDVLQRHEYDYNDTTGYFQRVYVPEHPQEQKIYQKIQISSFTNLKQLRLDNCQQLLSLEFLAFLDAPQLATIIIEKCFKIVNLRPLKKVQSKSIRQIYVSDIKTASYGQFYRVKFMKLSDNYGCSIAGTQFLNFNESVKLGIKNSEEYLHKIESIYGSLSILALAYKSTVENKQMFDNFQYKKLRQFMSKLYKMHPNKMQIK